MFADLPTNTRIVPPLPRHRRLNRKDSTGPDVFTAKQRLESLADGLISDAGKPRKRDVPEAQEASLLLEQAADGFGNDEGPVAVGDRREDLGGELLGNQGGALGLI